MFGTTPQPWEEICAKLNHLLKGWENYFQHGSQRKSLPRHQCPCAHARAKLLATAPQSILARYASVHSRPRLWRLGRAPHERASMRRTADSNAMNQVGKPDAGNPHVRFDERGKETGSRLPRLSSTLLKGCQRPLSEGVLRAFPKCEPSPRYRHGSAQNATAKSVPPAERRQATFVT